MMITLRIPAGFAAGFAGAVAAAVRFSEVPVSASTNWLVETASKERRTSDASAAGTNRQDVRGADLKERINMTNEARRRARRFTGGEVRSIAAGC